MTAIAVVGKTIAITIAITITITIAIAIATNTSCSKLTLYKIPDTVTVKQTE